MPYLAEVMLVRACIGLLLVAGLCYAVDRANRTEGVRQVIELQADYGLGLGWTTLATYRRGDSVDVTAASRGLVGMADSPSPARYRVVCGRGDVAHGVYEATGRKCTITYPASDDVTRVWVVEVSNEREA